MTVTQAAKACGLSRGTLLYYESLGLLRPAGRTAGNYRRYGAREIERLREIMVYRNAGVKLADIGRILTRTRGDATRILEKRFRELDGEIQRLRDHQRHILKLLRGKRSIERTDMITKDKWVAIMKAAGFTEPEMRRWHAEFERSAPEEHQEFLEFLHIPPAELASIRQWSRTGKPE